MTGLSRKLGLAVLVLGPISLASSANAANAAFASSPRQDLKGSFDEGVALLKRGREAEALEVLRGILASDPSAEEAFDLWQNTDQQVWIDLLVKGGEFEQIQKAMFERVNMGRATRESDPEVIRPLVDQAINASDALERRKAISQLARDHGEYAAPLLINFLRESADADQRVSAMHTLQTIGQDMVLPLVEALRSDDAVLRRSAAAALANIGDTRAAAAMAAVASSDAGETVRSIAEQAVNAMGAGADASGLYQQMGEDYRNRRESVLRSYQYSDVVWDWADNGLNARSVRPELYHDELAERAYRRALELDPGNPDALAGLANALVSQHTKLDQLAALGEDVAEVQEALSSDVVTIHLAGSDALDGALMTALAEDDASAAVGLCRMLAMISSEPSAALAAALEGANAATRAEAAISMGQIAMANGSDVDARAISVLAEAAGREVVHMVAIIDGDGARSNALVAALEAEGVSAQSWGNGATGLAMINRLPGVDLILVADHLDDITSFQVLGELKRRKQTAETPIIVLSSDEGAAELFGDQVTGVAQGVEDMEAIQAALEGDMNRDREEADRLAASAAEALAYFSRSGVDVSGAVGALASTLAHRGDAVTVPAMHALANAGGEGALAALAAVVSDGARSDEAREAAARASAGIFRRGGTASPEMIEALSGLVGSDASLSVRNAAALALGSTSAADDLRAGLLQNISGSPSN